MKDGHHHPKVHCWGGITSRGALKLELFDQVLEYTKYCSIMKKKIRELKTLYPEGFFWQQNGSGVHRSNLTADFIKKNMNMT